MTSPALQDIIALLGCPAAGNPAQYLFERAIEAAGIDCRFVTCDVPANEVAAALAGVTALGFRGCLLGGPLRTAALPLVVSASPSATFAGAVSLIELRPDGLAGHMTDGRGMVEAVRAHVDPTGRGVLVVGADACGRAAALELALAGAASVAVCDPDASRARDLVAALAGGHAAAASLIDWHDAPAVPAEAQIVVLTSDAARWPPPTGLRPDLVVADGWLAGDRSAAASAAADAGGCIVDGIEIHAAQTAIDFQTLTGAAADVEMLREALEEFLS
ncbi:MAG: shikimate dehydrogenase family protein [Pirellulales bacterium]